MTSRERPAPAVTVRPARLEDAAGIARVYNQGIEDRLATFETEPRTAADIRDALTGRGERYPTVVADGGSIVAAAWVSGYRARACYDGIAEFSVYVERAARGRG